MKLFVSSKPVIQVRGIHFDLSGLPPTAERLIQLLDLLAEAKINCVLVEWQDTYPWRKFPELRGPTAYSRETVRRFLVRAESLSIQVIPLVQSFGHMENVLSKKCFAGLREIPNNVSDICPCNPKSRTLVFDLINDVLETHADKIRYFHLGGDEVWTLGSCSKCKTLSKKYGKAHLYLQHVLPLIETLIEKGITPILWADDRIIMKWSLPMLRRISKETNLMPWSYWPNPFPAFPKKYLDRLAKAGAKIWGASAFKGATTLKGANAFDADVCDLENRVANTKSWVEEARRLNLVGIVATGWSRYESSKVPCEGLESSLDSLLLAGSLMWDGTLPSDYRKAAHVFLSRKRLREVAGERFFQCLQTSENLAKWREGLNLLVRQFYSFDMAREPERRNPYREREFYLIWREYLIRGRRFGQEWINAHSGLVPRKWLQQYIISRLSFALSFARKIDFLKRG